MKLLISFANFKGSLTNEEACALAKAALERLGHEARALPLGDGGKGTFSFLKTDSTAQEKTHSITGAFNDPREVRSWWKKTPQNTWQIFLESTEAIGYPPSDPERRDPLGATSRCLGEWLLQMKNDLADAPCELFIGLGDSAISDAGKGMLDVLGTESFSNWKITVLCDVDNPLCGERGAARVFSPQKGASANEVIQIEQNHLRFAHEIKIRFGKDVTNMPRGGSAGGLATALHVFLNAELVSGSQFVLSASNFEDVLKDCDVLLVGEGKTDIQTLSGKAPWEALKVAEKLKKKSILISGSFGEGIEQVSYPGLVAKTACGREPDAKTALTRAIEVALNSL
ncbi:MAG: glycerate kinase [Pseudomonadota bacterium]